MSDTIQSTFRTRAIAAATRIAVVLLTGGIVLSLLGCIGVVILAFVAPNGVMALMGIPALVLFAGVCGVLLALVAWRAPGKFPRGRFDAALNWGVFLIFSGIVAICYAHFG